MIPAGIANPITDARREDGSCYAVMEKVFVNIEKYANTSGASIPIALDEALRSGMIKRGDIVCLDGFGAGLTWASVVMKWY